MQAILRGSVQQRVRLFAGRERARVHRRGHQRHARHVKHRVAIGDLAGQRLARLLGGQFVVGHEHGRRDARIDRVLDRVETAVQRVSTGDRHRADPFGRVEVP